MDYLDFDLRISAGHDSDYEVVVICSVRGGEPKAITRVPLDEIDFMQPLHIIDALRSTGGNTRASDELQRHMDMPVLEVVDEAATARQKGLALFNIIFQREIYNSYCSSLEEAREQGKGLRLRFRIEAPEIAALPWEFLFENSERRHVSLYKRTPLTRYMELPHTPKVLTVQPPLRILGVVASPKDLPALNVEKEKRQIANAIEAVGESISLTWLEGATWRELLDAMEDGSWQIFHFIGHSGFDLSRGEGQIAFEKEDGRADFRPALVVGDILEENEDLRLVVLNACEGARISDSDLYSSVGTRLAQRGIPAVVSMQYEISDEAAVIFARELYDGLVTRRAPVDEAVARARQRLALTQHDSTEWATLVLHMRAPDGHLFREDFASPLRLQPRKVDERIEETVRRPPDTAEDKRGRDILLRKVQQIWIEGVFEKSLLGKDMIDLGMEALYGALDDPWTDEEAAADIHAETISGGQNILDVFNEGGRSLLILGEPGSGKSTAMLSLARHLLDQAQ